MIPKRLISMIKAKRLPVVIYSLGTLLILTWMMELNPPQGLRSLEETAASRQLSNDLGGGQCEWTEAQPLGEGANAFGTIIASYPASGMRVTWQHTEGITGIQVGDDFGLGGEGVTDKTGICKTQYPHLEGIWSWKDQFDQVVLLVRNPRYAIPSYHNLIHEIGYAHDWEAAYEGLNETFTKRAPMASWIKWRDYRIDDEINLWAWHINYWMEGGTRYWMEYDFERNGQYPFKFLDEADFTVDEHCVNDEDMNCVAKEIISYEKLKDSVTGPDELRKIANVLRNKQGMTVVSDEAIDCVYQETIDNKVLPDNENRSGPERTEYGFTIAQMEKMETKVQQMRAKYQAAPWDTNPLAQVLVGLFTDYLSDITIYLSELYVENLPAQTMSNQYHDELVSWYRGLGRGNRYNKAKVQAMPSMWRHIKALYDAGEEEDPNVYID